MIPLTSAVQATPEGVIIDVRVVPRSSRPGIAGMRDGALLVRLTAPPVEGAANAELVAVMAEALGVPKRSVSLASGERSRRKRVRVAGIAEQVARERLSAGGPPDEPKPSVVTSRR